MSKAKEFEELISRYKAEFNMRTEVAVTNFLFNNIDLITHALRLKEKAEDFVRTAHSKDNALLVELLLAGTK